MGTNGHSVNGFDTIREGLIGGDRPNRTVLNTIARSIEKGWIKPYDVPEDIRGELADLLMKSARRAAAGKNDRALRGAASAIMAIESHNLKVAEAVDKADRLDADLPTGNETNVTLEVKFDDNG